MLLRGQRPGRGRGQDRQAPRTAFWKRHCQAEWWVAGRGAVGRGQQGAVITPRGSIPDVGPGPWWGELYPTSGAPPVRALPPQPGELRSDPGAASQVTSAPADPVPLCLLCPRFQAPVPESCVDWKRHVPPSRALDPALSPSPVRAGPGVGPPGPRSLRSRLLPDRAGGTRRSCRPGRVTGVAEHRVSWAAAPGVSWAAAPGVSWAVAPGVSWEEAPGVSWAAIPGVSRAIPAAVMGMTLAPACTLSWGLWLRGSPGPMPVTVVSLDLSLRVAPRGAL